MSRPPRSAFTLVEVLAGLTVLSVIGLMVLTGVRWLLLIEVRSSRWLLARDRGRRVIAFVEPRLLHAGLGLSFCREAGALQRALGRGTMDSPPVARWPNSDRAVRVYKDGTVLLTPVQAEGGVLRGNGFCVLYARPSGVILRTPGNDALLVAPGETVEFEVLTGSLADAGFRVANPQDLRAWGVLPLAGMPFHLLAARTGRLSLLLAPNASSPAPVSPVSELLSLRCERFWAWDGVFRFQGMTADWTPANFYPREEGVLSLWVEWRPGRRVFDLWVLASGGAAVFGPSARPAEWPADAPWTEDFAQHELYVSRASWRLENL